MEIGTKIIVYRDCARSISEVIGETKTSWRIKNGSLYDKNSMHLRGGGDWVNNRIVVADQQMIDEVNQNIARKNLINKLINTKWENYDIEQLREIEKHL